MNLNVCDDNETVVNPALILMPDISGFTQYISASAITHSQVNIARLLESVIDANELDLTISEIEGDAILFYKFNDDSSFDDIAEQIKKMYFNFHQVLRDINENNDCECGACSLLYNLSLKFIVHFGEVGSVMVKGYCKLFGGDVIIAHRLLKNSVPLEEYVLFTDAFIKKYNTQASLILKFEKNSDEYDVLGNIQYYYSSLNKLQDHHKLLPEDDKL
jgi:Protein of unknown function (DUF2652)